MLQINEIELCFLNCKYPKNYPMDSVTVIKGNDIANEFHHVFWFGVIPPGYTSMAESKWVKFIFADNEDGAIFWQHLDHADELSDIVPQHDASAEGYFRVLSQL
jgi:hypothetical protein